MFGIKFIQHKNIDKQKWDDCIGHCEKAPIYGYSWYLDAICKQGWNALVLNDYEAVFPLPVKSKFGIPIVYQPFFCQQLGLFQRSQGLFDVRDFLNAIPKKYLKVHLQMRQTENEANLNLPTRTNYVLHLLNPYPIIEKNYSADCKKNLRKAKSEPIEFTMNQDYASVISLYRQVWGGLNPKVKDENYAQFANACAAAAQREMLFVVNTELNGQVLGKAIFLKSRHFLHYVCAAPTELGRKYGIMHSIIDFTVQKYANQDMFLDFEGSENENVAGFYLKFNPVRADYWVFQRNII